MNTPLLYSCVPIAPSKTMTCSGSRSRAISGLSGNCHLRFGDGTGCGTAHGVVPGFRMVDYDRRRRLLRQQLERFGEVHPKRFFRGKELEHRCVVVEIRTRSVAPRITLSTRYGELLLNSTMRPFGDGFRGFDGQPVRIEGFAVLVLCLKLLEPLARFLSHRHDLKWHDIDVA